MTEFVKVRSKGGPKAEYFVGAEELAAHPERYVVIDKRSRSAVDDKKPAPQVTQSVGNTTKEEA